MMQEEIYSVIDKNLPAAIGEQLRKRLEQAEKTDGENKKLAKEIERLKGELQAANGELKQHTTLDARERTILQELQSMADRERQLERRESDLERTVLQTKLECADDKLCSIYKLAEIALGKRSMMEKFSRSENRDVPVGVPTNGYVSNQRTQEHVTTERSVEEIG